MKTSYFAHYKGVDGVAITVNKPYWFNGEHYSKLAPTKDLLFKYKNNEINEEQYEEIYRKEILDKLNAKEVYEDLKDKVILCYEKPPKFCHRHIVAWWIKEQLGIHIIEI